MARSDVVNRTSPISLNIDASCRLVAVSRPDGLDRLHEGIWLEDRLRLLPWGMTWEQFAGMPDVVVRLDPEASGYQDAFLADATLLGGVELSELACEFWSPDRLPDRPLTEFWAWIPAGEPVFELLSGHFRCRLGEAARERVLDEEIERIWELGRQRLVLSLCPRFDRQTQIRSMQCCLRLSHDLDASAFLEDAYTRVAVPHPGMIWRVLEVKLRLPGDFKTESHLRTMPGGLASLLPDDEKMLIWRDDVAGCVGIGNLGFACILEIKKLTGLEVEEVHMRGNFYYCILNIYGVDRNSGSVLPCSLNIDLRPSLPAANPVNLALQVEACFGMPVQYRLVDLTY